jgi:hypothetical protein
MFNTSLFTAIRYSKEAQFCAWLAQLLQLLEHAFRKNSPSSFISIAKIGNELVQVELELVAKCHSVIGNVSS